MVSVVSCEETRERWRGNGSVEENIQLPVNLTCGAGVKYKCTHYGDMGLKVRDMRG